MKKINGTEVVESAESLPPRVGDATLFRAACNAALVRRGVPINDFIPRVRTFANQGMANVYRGDLSRFKK